MAGGTSAGAGKSGKFSNARMDQRGRLQDSRGQVLVTFVSRR